MRDPENLLARYVAKALGLPPRHPLDILANGDMEVEVRERIKYVSVAAPLILASAAAHGPHYVLDPNDVVGAYLGDLTEFPPLPHPAIWIEFRDHEWDVCRVCQWRLPDGVVDLCGAAVFELDQGERWIVVPAGIHDSGAIANMTVRVLRPGVDTLLTAEGDIRHDLGYGDDGDDWPVGLYALTAVHLITAARGVRHVPLVGSRPVRRRLEREHKGQPPKAYFVEIGSPRSESAGTSGREYHVRWMVRGHWKHHTRGPAYANTERRADCSTCGTCVKVWTPAHVKGPVGAPWKGQPVYVKEKDAA